jgi:ABC-type cobalamin transport system permease subunit
LGDEVKRKVEDRLKWKEGLEGLDCLLGDVLVLAKGNFWFLTISWMAKAGNLSVLRLKLPAR